MGDEAASNKDEIKTPAKSQTNIKVYKKKCANLMDKINRLAGSKGGPPSSSSQEVEDQQQQPDAAAAAPEAAAAKTVAAAAAAAGIFSEMLGVKPCSIDRLFSSPNTAATILGLNKSNEDPDSSV